MRFLLWTVILFVLTLTACSRTTVHVERSPDGSFVGDYSRYGDQQMNGLEIRDLFGTDISIEKKENQGMSAKELMDAARMLAPLTNQ